MTTATVRKRHRRERIIRYLSDHAIATASIVAEALDIPISTAYRDLRSLVRRNLATKMATWPRTYQLSAAGVRAADVLGVRT